MITPFDVDANRLLVKTATKLKDISAIKAPDWMQFVKSGSSRDRAPEQKDFWYLRCAAMLRKIYVQGPKGVSRLRTDYGSKKNNGVRRSHFAKAGGSIIRKGLQQLEKAGLLTKLKTGGRTLTAKGRALMDSAAKEAA
jgi:small subunit ribosomal protein S19e